MPRSFKDEGSDRASSEFLIEHDTRPRNAKKRPWGTVQAVIAGVLILVGVMEMIILESILLRFGAKDCPQPLLGELNDLVPTFSLQPVLFRKDSSATVDHSSEQSRNETRDDWLSYMPRGNGFIAVNNSAQHKLPDPIPFEGKSAYSIAVFHQMHCLYAIMDTYNDLTSSQSDGQDHGHHDGRRGAGKHAHNHVDHCFRYLRQSLLCCGDTALEGQDPRTSRQGTDGTGAVHMCKDFEAIRSWAEENRLVDTKHP